MMRRKKAAKSTKKAASHGESVPLLIEELLKTPLTEPVPIEEVLEPTSEPVLPSTTDSKEKPWAGARTDITKMPLKFCYGSAHLDLTNLRHSDSGYAMANVQATPADGTNGQTARATFMFHETWINPEYEHPQVDALALKQAKVKITAGEEATLTPAETQAKRNNGIIKVWEMNMLSPGRLSSAKKATSSRLSLLEQLLGSKEKGTEAVGEIHKALVGNPGATITEILEYIAELVVEASLSYGYVLKQQRSYGELTEYYEVSKFVPLVDKRAEEAFLLEAKTAASRSGAIICFEVQDE